MPKKTWEIRSMDEADCAAAARAAAAREQRIAEWVTAAIREKIERDNLELTGEILRPDTAENQSGQNHGRAPTTGQVPAQRPGDELFVLAQAASCLRFKEGSRTPVVVEARRAVLARIKEVSESRTEVPQIGADRPV